MLTEFFLSDTVLGAADKIVNTDETLAPLVPFSFKDAILLTGEYSHPLSGNH